MELGTGDGAGVADTTRGEGVGTEATVLAVFALLRLLFAVQMPKVMRRPRPKPTPIANKTSFFMVARGYPIVILLSS